MNWVKSRAHRILRQLDRYQSVDTRSSGGPAYIADIPLQRGELLLGVYENHRGEHNESIAVTDRGLYIARNESWEYVRYEQIGDVHVDASSGKSEADSLEIHLTSGQITEVVMEGSKETPIKGGLVTTRDVFEFQRFLLRAPGDARRTQEEERNNQHT